MKRIFCIAACLVASFIASAQEEGVFRMALEARAEYQKEYQSGQIVNNASGLRGKYLNLRIDGNISENLSYSFRHRLNKPIVNSSFFDATDWITLNYTTGSWTFSGGKQVVGIGGFEYDAAPIDLYFCSEYWNNIACYQFGISATYALANGKDNIMLQLCESPFRTNAANVERKEMSAYNLMWMGSHGMFSSLYSFNMIEYLPGKYINYVVLGNRFTFGRMRFDLDLMNRALSCDGSLGKDISIMSSITWSLGEKLDLFAKLTHDTNSSKEAGDWCVVPGTDITRVGGGLEYYPIRDSRNLRMHLFCCHNFGEAAPSGVLRPQQTLIDAGITWKMNMLNIIRR